MSSDEERVPFGWTEIVERKRWGDREGEGTADFAMGGRGRGNGARGGGGGG